MLVRSSLRTAAPVLVVALIGCAPAEEPEPIAATQQPLISQPENELPAVEDFPLKVCFRPDNGADEGDGTLANRAEVRARVEAAWEGLPRSAVAFTGWETCVTDDDSYAKINLDSSVGRGLFRWGAKSMRLVVGSTDYAAYTTIHEFGHALGIVHEQAHPDKPSTCEEDDDIPSGGIVLTDYDPDAVMNYCSTNLLELTEREKLFTEMAYPTDTANHPIRGSYAYYLGDTLLVRSNATLETDWTFRGARPTAYAQVQWFVDGNLLTALADVSVPAASIAPSGTGSATVDYAFEDFRGTWHSSETRSVTVSNSRHAAITTTVL